MLFYNFEIVISEIMFEHVAFFTCPRQARPSATRNRPAHRPQLTHIAQIQMVVDRPDANIDVL
jgi:hypothetical protein